MPHRNCLMLQKLRDSQDDIDVTQPCRFRTVQDTQTPSARPQMQQTGTKGCWPIIWTIIKSRNKPHLLTHVPEHQVVVCAVCDQLVAILHEASPQGPCIGPHLQLKLIGCSARADYRLRKPMRVCLRACQPLLYMSGMLKNKLLVACRTVRHPAQADGCVLCLFRTARTKLDRTGMTGPS